MNSKIYDAIVVGSGATGGWAAMELTRAGLSVLLVEKGGPPPPPDGAEPPAPSGDEPRQPVQRRHGAFNPRNAPLFADDLEQPYTTAPGQPFLWIRGGRLGGRTLLWGGQAWRMSDALLQSPRHDGAGLEWPLTAAELAPHYERVERFLGIHGSADGLHQVPDGCFHAPSPLTPAEARIRSAIQARLPAYRATPLRACSGDPGAACGPYGRWPVLTSLGSTLAAAYQTGRLELRLGDAARAVTVDRRTGRAAGVLLARRGGTEEEVRGRVVVLAASTIETTRILLASACPLHPHGLGNGSGVLGAFLTDKTCTGATGVLRAPGHPDDGRADIGRHGLYIPFPPAGHVAPPTFTRGYSVWIVAQSSLPQRPGPVPPGCVAVFMLAIGEMLPRERNRVALADGPRDAWGVPAVRIECAHGDDDLRMAAHQRLTLEALAGAAGIELDGPPDDVLPPGLMVHEAGTARMGRDPRTSVLNPDQQCWEVPNLFVVDGAAWPSNPYPNPALTLMALASRASRGIVRLMRQRAL
ncbi:MAG TPA: GMC family oxidoreductase [Longimicrobium sp.]|nr:GMC family oxidoreductase [Longimicrobium sp.]